MLIQDKKKRKVFEMLESNERHETMIYRRRHVVEGLGTGSGISWRTGWAISRTVKVRVSHALAPLILPGGIMQGSLRHSVHATDSRGHCEQNRLDAAKCQLDAFKGKLSGYWADGARYGYWLRKSKAAAPRPYIEHACLSHPRGQAEASGCDSECATEQ